MILLDVYVVFHTLEDDWYSRLITRLTKTPTNHCGIMVSPQGSSPVYYLTRVDKPMKAADGKAYLRLKPPQSIYYIGSTAQQQRKVLDLKKSYIIRPWKILLWYFVTRFIYPPWKPQSCSMFSCKLLQSMGFNIKTHMRPDDLLKELKNADNYVERQGKSWEDLLSTEDC
tara:strand:- start:1151 stop:1660 length:510 start_codon:yes stop_codon:yes gene_type:complete